MGAGERRPARRDGTDEGGLRCDAASCGAEDEYTRRGRGNKSSGAVAAPSLRWRAESGEWSAEDTKQPVAPRRLFALRAPLSAIRSPAKRRRSGASLAEAVAHPAHRLD